VLKAICVAMLLAIGAGFVGSGFAQEPFVTGPDSPGPIGIGGGEEAISTTALNVRESPGTRHPVIDVLRPGQSVIVTSCRGGWCSVNQSGPSGWVSERYLQRTSASANILRQP